MAIYIEFTPKTKKGEQRVVLQGRVDGYACGRKGKMYCAVLVEEEAKIYQVALSQVRVIERQSKKHRG